MKERLQQRLTELHSEFEAGQKVLAELEAKQADVRQTLLRINGAIQVLEEELALADTDSSTQEPSANGQVIEENVIEESVVLEE